MKNFFKDFLFFVILLFLSGASLYGVNIPENTPVRQVGVMQIAPFKDGLSLFQGNRREYYSFSPANDYTIDSQNNRSAFISEQELINNDYKSSYRELYWKDIGQTILGYFDMANPSIAFFTKKTMKYTTQIENNKLTARENIAFPDDNIKPRLLGITMSFKGVDFVYDASSNLYQYWGEKDQASFASTYGISFIPKIEDLRPQITDGKIVIVNPRLNGSIVIRAKPGQRLFVNRNAKLIEIEQMVYPKEGYYTISMQIEIYDNPKEANKAL